MHMTVYVSLGWLILDRYSHKRRESFLDKQVKTCNEKLAKEEIKRVSEETKFIMQEVDNTNLLLKCMKKIIAISEEEAKEVLEERKKYGIKKKSAKSKRPTEK